MAKSTLGSLLIDLQLNTATLNKQVSTVNKKFDGMAKTFKTVGVALAGAFAVRGFTTMINNTLQLNDALGKTADRLGVAVEDLQALRFSAEQSGVSTNDLEIGLQRMTRRLSDATLGSGTAVKSLKELGLEADKLAKMTVNEQLGVLADALQGVESEADKVRIAFSLFDSGGVKLLTMLKDGSAGLKAYADEANSLGFIIDRQMIGMMESANDSMNKLDKVAQGMRNTLTVALAPAITVVTEEFVDWITEGKGAQGMLKNLHGAIRSVLQSIDVLNIALKTSASGWGLLGQTATVVAEGLFGTEESLDKANKKLLEMSNSADKAFTSLVEGFYNGEGLAGDFDIQLETLTVTADKASNGITKLGNASTASASKMKKATEKITDEAKTVEHVFTNAFKNMENFFIDFAKTGKLSFTDFTESILEDLARMIIQLQITIPLMNALKSSMGATGSTGIVGAITSMFGFAKGGAISNGVQAFASGGVVNSPTLFPMASGMGLMGEAGAEAIMPLTRTSNGDLGVKAVGSSGGGNNTIVNVYNQSNSEAEVSETTNADGQKTIDIMIKASVERSIGTGALDNTFSQNYGISRKGY